MRAFLSGIFCLILLIGTADFAYSQSICDLAEPLCSNENFSGNPPSGNPGGSIDGGCQMLEADDVTWYVVRIQSGTTFTFVIDPDGSDDYDFAVWKNPDCDNLGTADRASYAAPTPYSTGLSMSASDVCETAFGDGYVKYIDVQPGDLILIAIDKFSDDGDGFTLIFGNGGSGEGNAELDCTIVGESYGICDEDTNGQEDFDLNVIAADLTTGQPSWTVEFYEVETDAQAGNTNTETSPYTAYFANNPTELFARIEQSGTFLRVVQIFLHVNELPEINTPVELTLCDLGNDGTEAFDLTLAESLIAPGLNNFIYKYYELEADAIAGGLNFINPATAYNSGAGTIYVRVETGPVDGNLDGCFDVGEIDLILTQGVVSEFDLVDEYCLDSTPPALPGVSDNGFSGTWFPSDVIDTSVLGPATYTFTPDADECALEYEIEITIVEGVLPQFTMETTFCQGIMAPALPNTSDGGVTGTWSPAIIDTSNVGTFTYTFTPDDPECNLELEVEITINNGVELNNSVQVELCDENFDGTFEYDLTLLDGELITPTTGLTFSYYATLANYNSNTPIPATQWNNYPMTLPTTIFVVAENEDGCRSEYVEVDFVEGQAIPLLSGPYEIPICENQPIDLTDFEANYTNENGIDFTYYLTQANAEDEIGAITGTSNYTPAGIGASIFVRLDKQDGSLCPEIVEIEFIEGQAIPLLTGPYEIPFCEGEPVDLTEFESNYTSEMGVDFKYYPTLANAESETQEITDITNYNSSDIDEPIFVRIEKLDGSLCPEIIVVEFIEGQEVQHNAGPYGPLEYCEDEVVDITIYTSSIPNETGVDITYYLSQSDAENEINAIPDETIFEPTGNGTIYVRLEKSDRCTVILELPFEQKPAPLIENIPDQEILCEGQETITLEAESDDPNATFEWSWGNGQTSSGATITITETGTYTVTAIGSNGCRSTQEVEIRPGGTPIIASIESGTNYIVVLAQPGNGGTLEYSLNGVLWQTSPRFDGLNKGETYTVYVREDGCEVSKYTVVILDVPNFVSPNGDGYNDVWTIRGIEVTPAATIKIFDRYGKIFVDTNFDGNYLWDGKYGGRPVPSGDYWYILEVPTDGVILPQKFVGSISIRN